MGKNLIQQARGKGGPRYKAPSFKYIAKSSYPDNNTVQTTGKIMDIVKCRGHSGPLAQIKYDNGEETYVVSAENVKVGDVVNVGAGAPLENGNTLYLKEMPIGTSIFNIEGRPGDGGKFVRSGGCFAKVIGKSENTVL